MSYFDKDFLDFFNELEKNNNKEWFHDQKKRYEASVKKPFYNFLADFISNIQKQEKDFAIEPKDCVLRINRDIRFAKDKTPYNVHFTAIVSKVGRKDKSIPGIFLRFSPNMIAIMSGSYILEKEQLHKIRTAINADASVFKKLIGAKSFVAKFGEIKGETMKRIPKEWQAAAEREPLILNKQFYFVAEREPELLLNKDLLATILDYWKAAKPVNDYLINCIK